jgi:uncharacterized protein
MKTLCALAVMLALVLQVKSAAAASFDCKLAASTSEHLICSTPDLSQADDLLGKLVSEAKALSSVPASLSADAIKAWQWREANCFDVPCLERWYGQRILYYSRLVDAAPHPAMPPAQFDQKPSIPAPVVAKKAQASGEQSVLYQRIRSGKKAPDNLLDAARAYEVHASAIPLIEASSHAPDGKAYLLSGRIEKAADGDPRFLGSIRSQAGRSYFCASISKPFRETFYRNGQIDGLVLIIGMYTFENRLLLDTGRIESIPCFEIVYLQFGFQDVEKIDFASAKQ